MDPKPRVGRNEQRLLAALERSAGLKRSDLARVLDLPASTVSGLVHDLAGRGLVVEQACEPDARQTGRPARLVQLAGPRRAIGVLAWSAGMLQVAVAGYGGEVHALHAVETDAQDVHGVVDAGLALLDEALTQAEVSRDALASVVLGVPGPFQRGVGAPREPLRAGRQRHAGWLRDDPSADLAQRLGVPALVENDANLGALGEHAFGAAAGLDSFVFLRWGQGIGAGLVLNGRLYRGATGFAGELSHVQVRDDGPLCSCGSRGCLRTLLGPSLAELVQPAYGRALTFGEVADRADHGEPASRRMLGDLGRTLGRPLADLCTLLNPQAIVLDGALGVAGPHIAVGIREMLDRHAAPTAADAVTVMHGALGARADILGAVALAREPQAV
jgi:predicted NBD/HSP70 family sugar kinase